MGGVLRGAPQARPSAQLSHLPVRHVLTAWQSLSPQRQPDGHEDTGAQDRTRDADEDIVMFYLS